MRDVQLKDRKDRKWLATVATVAATVLVLQIVGLFSREVAWALGSVALVVIIAAVVVPWGKR